MYLHLGSDTVVKTDEIIGIFDMDNTTVSKHTKKLLAQSEKNGEVVNVSYELPKSFIICSSLNRRINKRKKIKKKIYISQLSSKTLVKRDII